MVDEPFIFSVTNCVPEFNPIQVGVFGNTPWWEVGKKGPLLKICHTYLTMIKLGTVMPYLKKTQNVYESRKTPLEFWGHQNFFTENYKILQYQERQM